MAMIVNATTIDAAIGGAEICLHELQSAATTLQSEAPNVGIGQEDVHLQQFLGIVNQCVTALEAPQANLQKNIGTLQTLVGIVRQMESSSIS